MCIWRRRARGGRVNGTWGARLGGLCGRATRTRPRAPPYKGPIRTRAAPPPTPQNTHQTPTPPPPAIDATSSASKPHFPSSLLLDVAEERGHGDARDDQAREGHEHRGGPRGGDEGVALGGGRDRVEQGGGLGLWGDEWVFWRGWGVGGRKRDVSERDEGRRSVGGDPGGRGKKPPLLFLLLSGRPSRRRG